MANEVVIPKLGFAMEAGELREWFVTDGDRVEAGQIIFSVESDKSINEVEASAAGVIRILKENGDEYPVGTVIAVIE